MKIKLNYQDLMKQLNDYQIALDEYENRSLYEDDDAYDAFASERIAYREQIVRLQTKLKYFFKKVSV